MAFLSSIGKTLLLWVLEWTWGKFAAWLKSRQRQEEIQKEAEASVEPLKQAETGKEIDDATDDAFRKL